jgi:hypothetical protein
VPLALTMCGPKLSVLWQVDVGFDVEAEQQVVKGGGLFDPLEVNTKAF